MINYVKINCFTKSGRLVWAGKAAGVHITLDLLTSIRGPERLT